MAAAHMSEQEIRALDAVAQNHRVPRSVVIRWAILHYLRHIGAASSNDPANDTSSPTSSIEPAQPR